MNIIAENIGKKFNREWIFRNLNLSLKENNTYAITGPNGSGKSTLLQILCGIMPYSEGRLSYSHSNLQIHSDDYYKYITLATPYEEVIEEFTLAELLKFHLKFKPFKKHVTKEIFYEKLLLTSSINKEIKYFSSGMKQRVKLGLALYSDSPILFLDEPTSNLDTQGIDWYLSEIKQNLDNRLVVICSNQKYEFDFCDQIIYLGQ